MKFTLEELWLSARYVTNIWFEGYDEHKTSNPKMALAYKTRGIVKYDRYYDNFSSWDLESPIEGDVFEKMKKYVGEP